MALRATAHQVSTLLRRTSTIPITPEVILLIAVIRQAWEDAQSVDNGAGARRFFTDGRGAQIAGLVGIDGEFLADVFRKHHSKAELLATQRGA